VLNSFPEGEYEFRGRTVEGDRLGGTAFLSHILAPETKILTPQEDEVVALDNDNVVVTWDAVPKAICYIVEIKNEETEKALLAEVSAGITSFHVSASWLDPETEHQVAVGVVTASGNLTNVESAFFSGTE